MPRKEEEYRDLADPDSRRCPPFPCWVCGGPTVKLRNLSTRYCGVCEVMELRHEETYVIRTRIEKTTPDGSIFYIDHSSECLPSPG